MRFHRYLLLLLLIGCRSEQQLVTTPSEFIVAASTAVAVPPPQSPVIGATCVTRQALEASSVATLPGLPSSKPARPVSYHRRPGFSFRRALGSHRPTAIQRITCRLARRPSAPAMNGGQASFLLVIMGLLIGIGSFLLTRLVGGWLGISGGILLGLGALYLCLFAGLLAEYGSDKPFRFVDLLTL